MAAPSGTPAKEAGRCECSGQPHLRSPQAAPGK